MTNNRILFIYPDQVKSIETLINAVDTPHIVIMDQVNFNSDEIVSTINAVDTLEHAGVLYEQSVTANGFPANLNEILELVHSVNPQCTVDLLTCNLNERTHKTFTEDFESKYTGLTIRYSIDLTGHPNSLGNWIMESHNVSVKSLYFNETIDQWNHTLSLSLERTFDYKFTMKHVPFAGYNLGEDQGYNLNYYDADGRTVASEMSFNIEYMAEHKDQYTTYQNATTGDHIKLTLNNPQNQNFGGDDHNDTIIVTTVNPAEDPDKIWVVADRVLQVPVQTIIDGSIVEQELAEPAETHVHNPNEILMPWPSGTTLWLVFLPNNRDTATWYMKLPIPAQFDEIYTYFNGTEQDWPEAFKLPDILTRNPSHFEGDAVSAGFTSYKFTVDDVPFHGTHAVGNVSKNYNYYKGDGQTIESGVSFNIEYNSVNFSSFTTADRMTLTINIPSDSTLFDSYDAFFVTETWPEHKSSNVWDWSDNVSENSWTWARYNEAVIELDWSSTTLWLVLRTSDGTSPWSMQVPIPPTFDTIVSYFANFALPQGYTPPVMTTYLKDGEQVLLQSGNFSRNNFLEVVAYASIVLNPDADTDYENSPNWFDPADDSTWLNSAITAVIFKDDITHIGNGAFNGCSSLTSIAIPESVTTMGNFVFEDTGLIEVTWDLNIAIPDDTFKNASSLTTVILSNCTEIGDNAFNGCVKLASVTMPSVSIFGASAFKGCSQLTNINLSGVTTIKDYAFQFCSGLTLTNRVIPASITSIGRNVFEGTAVTQVTWDLSIEIPDGTFKNASSLTDATLRNCSRIGISAFRNCTSLTSVTMSGVEIIDAYAFSDCTQLSDFNLSGVKTINSFAFASCPIQTFVIPESVTSMGSYVFRASGLDEVIWNSSIAIPSGTFQNTKSLRTLTLSNCTAIGIGAFYESAIPAITIPNSVHTINADAFKNCSQLETVTIPNSVTTIGTGLFIGATALAEITWNSAVAIPDSTFKNTSSLTTVTLANCVGIGQQAFKASGLTSIELPATLISIGFAAFMDCSAFTRITIPVSVTDIGDSLFQGTAVTEVTWDSAVPISTELFANTPLTTINITNCAAFETGAFRESQLTAITIPNSVTSIGEHAFFNCTKLTSVTIPASVTSMGASLFDGANALSEITWNSTVAIPYATFKNASSLTTVTLRNCTEIGGAAFENCLNLSHIDLNNVETIGDQAFKRCTSLTSIAMPVVEEIRDEAFYGVTIGHIVLPATLKTVGYDVFANAVVDSITTSAESTEPSTFQNLFSNITLSELIWNASSKIPENMMNDNYALKKLNIANCTEIGPSAFSGCTALTDVTISNVGSIGGWAFAFCYSLTSITMSLSSSISIAESAFAYGSGNIVLITINNNDIATPSYINFRIKLSSSAPDWDGNTLSGKDLTGADLTGADLSNADLTGAVLTNAVLTGADLTGADLSGADLTNVMSGGITGVPAALPSNFEIINGSIIIRYTKNLRQSWSLVNASIINQLISDNQQDKIESVWGFDGHVYTSQAITSTLDDNGYGYWINCKEPITINIINTLPIYSNTLRQSWSIVNARSINQLINNNQQYKIEAVRGYDGHVYTTQAITSALDNNGEGYWINCKEDIQL